jgi:hypothetical protein
VVIATGGTARQGPVGPALQGTGTYISAVGETNSGLNTQLYRELGEARSLNYTM